MRTHRAFITLNILFISPALASGQSRVEPAPALPKANAAVAGQAGEGKPHTDLTHRYRFVERYTAREEQAGPGLVGQYHVAIQEVLKDSVETPEGPTRPKEVTRHTIFTERPVEVSNLGVVIATVRSYQRFQVDPDHLVRPPAPRPLDGLTIWLRPRVTESPLVLSLSEGRRMTDREYEIVAHQVDMPNLAALLPSVPVRVGDTWRVARKAVQAMFGETDLRGDSLSGKFLELRQDDDGKTSYAVLRVVGRVVNATADTTINAQLLFAFMPSIPSQANDPSSPTGTSGLTRSVDEPLVEAQGAITELRMARVATGVLPKGTMKNQRYRAVQELVLERKLGIDEKTGPISLVDAPVVTDSNSWLTHIDARGRFFFHHPQDLLPPDRHQFEVKPGGDSIVLAKNRPDGRDLVRIEVFAKEQTPEALKALLHDQWKQVKVEILPGNDEWLHEAEWPKMKVFRVEAALKLPSPPSRGSRVHYDAYLVKITKDFNLMVFATTNREGVAAFRHDVEQMIKTFDVGSVMIH